MLSITYNTYDIPLDESFVMRFSWVNPACKFDKVPGAAGLGIDIPVNDYTRGVFGHPNRFEKYSAGNDRKFPDVAIRFSGVVLMVGTLNITNATSETYTGWLQSQVGVIGEEQRERKINELQLPGEIEPWSNYRIQLFENKNNFDQDVDNYCTGEHYNPRFWEEIGRTVTDTEEYYDDDGLKKPREIEITLLAKYHKDYFNFLVNKTQNGGTAITTGQGCVVSAFLFLNFLLKEVFKRCSIFIDPDNNAFTDTLDNYRNIAVYNNYNLMVPTITTEDKDAWERDPVTGQDVYVGSKEIKTFSWELGDQGGFDYVHLIPGVNVGDFIMGIQNLLNIVFHFRDDSKVVVIDRLEILTMDAFDLSSYLLGEWIIGERKNTTLKFVSEYDKDDALISDNFHDLTDRRHDFGEPVRYKEDLDALALPDYGEIRHVIENDEWYEYKWDVGINNDGVSEISEFDRVGWVKVSTGPQPVFYGTGDELEEIKTNVYTPYTHEYQLRISKMQNGVIAPTRNLWNNFTPCFFFYVSDNSISTRNAGQYNTSLQWVDRQGLNEIGLFTRRWEPWAAFWNNRLPVEGDFNLPLNVLYYVINNITSKFKTEQGEFIIEEMEVEFGLHMIGKTHIKGFKLP